MTESQLQYTVQQFFCIHLLHIIPETFKSDNQFEINVLSRHDRYNLTELNVPQKMSNVGPSVAINTLSGLVKYSLTEMINDY